MQPNLVIIFIILEICYLKQQSEDWIVEVSLIHITTVLLVLCCNIKGLR